MLLKKAVSGKCISHIYYDRPILKGHTIRRNLKRFSWLGAKCCLCCLLCCLFFGFVLFFQTCIFHPKIKCTTTMHIKTTKIKPPQECRKYGIFAKNAARCGTSADRKCSCMCIGIFNKQLQLCTGHVSFNCVLISCIGMCRGRASCEPAGPWMMPPPAREEPCTLCCEAAKWTMMVSNVEKIASVSS